MGTLSILCYLIFILSAIILIVVVLLQEVPSNAGLPRAR